MSRSITVDSSPPIHRGMVVLDKDAFRKSVTVLAAKVPPIKAGVVLEAKEMKKRVHLCTSTAPSYVKVAVDLS